MDDFLLGVIVVALVVIAFAVPARLDPAIRLKDRNERKRREAGHDVRIWHHRSRRQDQL